MPKPRTLFKEAFNASLDLLAGLEIGAILPRESEIGERLDVSRTTTRAVIASLTEAGIVQVDGRRRSLRRRAHPSDRFPEEETDQVATVIERYFMRWLLEPDARPGSLINELEFARAINVSTSAVREFMIRFSRFGLIRKRRNRQWTLEGITRDFALELTEVRELFELRSARAVVELPGAHPIWPALDAIETEHEAMLAAVDERYREFSELDERFHRLVHEASHNRFVTDFYDVIAMVFHYHYQWNKADEKDRNRVAIQEHLDYIRALKNKNAMDVDYYCKLHLRSARETMLKASRD